MKLKFRADIEGLRAIAIVLVVLFHAGWRWASGGYLGVDVFFALSGFLITGLLAEEVAASGAISLTHFWARRARRLLPAAFVVTLVVLAANAVRLAPFEQITYAATARAFAVYASNILFAVRSSDYFGDAAVRDPLLHTWSLSVEEQFYLVFAPLLLLLAMSTRARGFEAFRRRFTFATVILSILSFAGCILLVRRYPIIAFFSLPTRAWEFGLGALAVLVVRDVDQLGAGTQQFLSVAGLAALVASAVFVPEGTSLGWATLVPTLGTVALIVSGAGAEQTVASRLLSTAPMRLIGRLSYSWYLWHWPVLVYLREQVPDASLRLRIAAAVLSLAPAAVTYRFVESPIRFSKRLQRYHGRVVIGAVVLAIVTLLASSAAIVWAKRTLDSPRYAGILASRASARTYSDGCQVPLMAVTSPPCTYGLARSDTTVVLFGDSHAAQWFPAFESVVAMRGWRLVNLTKTGCPSVWAVLPNAKLGRRYYECERWRDAAIRRIIQQRPALVVVTNIGTYAINVGDRELRTDSSALARREWADGMVRTLRALASSGSRLVVIEDTPHPGFDVPRCLVKYIDDATQCDVPRLRAIDTVLASAERAAVRSVPGVASVNLNSFICDGAICPVSKAGVVRYRDDNHLAIRYAASLAPALSEALTHVLAEPVPRKP